jgi:hypothetical protein
VLDSKDIVVSHLPVFENRYFPNLVIFQDCVRYNQGFRDIRFSLPENRYVNVDRDSSREEHIGPELRNRYAMRRKTEYFIESNNSGRNPAINMSGWRFPVVGNMPHEMNRLTNCDLRWVYYGSKPSALVYPQSAYLSAPLEEGNESVDASKEGYRALYPKILPFASLFSIIAGFLSWRWWWNSFNDYSRWNDWVRALAFVGSGILWVLGIAGVVTWSTQS